MRLVAFVIIALTSSTALAGRPADNLPWVIDGVVTNGTASHPYRAVWDMEEDGYRFQPPGVGGDLGVLITVDVDGLATCGTVTADWSRGAIGVPIVGSSMSFVPLDEDYGLSFDVQRIAALMGWGFLFGFGFDLTFCIYGATIGGTVRAAGKVAGD
jgi:hypothetical protein